MTAALTYIEQQRLWWPSYDHKKDKAYGFIQRRLPDADLTLPFVKSRELCVQAGGHIGLWPLRLSARFQYVVTFEPDPDTYEALVRNCQGIFTITSYRYALGRCSAEVMFDRRASSGNGRIGPQGKIPVTQVSLDDLLATSRLRLGALVLDVEGYEAEVLEGARRLIGKHRPVIQVELLQGKSDQTRDWLKDAGYRQVTARNNDAVYVR